MVHGSGAAKSYLHRWFSVTHLHCVHSQWLGFFGESRLAASKAAPFTPPTLIILSPTSGSDRVLYALVQFPVIHTTSQLPLSCAINSASTIRLSCCFWSLAFTASTSPAAFASLFWFSCNWFHKSSTSSVRHSDCMRNLSASLSASTSAAPSGWPS